MKKLLSASLLPGLAALALLPARAAFDPAIVPASSRWVIYADLNALRDSTVGKELLAMAEQAQVDTPTGKIGVDGQKLLATVGTITAYGANFSNKPEAIDGALIAQGTPDLRKIAEGMLVQATITSPEAVSEFKDLPFPAYIAGKNEPPKDGEKKAAAGKSVSVIIAFPPEPVILVSKSKEQLLRAYDAFRGRGPTAKSSDSPLRSLLGNAPGSILFAASVAPAPSDKLIPTEGPQARILQMASAGSVALGEKDGNTFARAELVAASDEMADKLMKILQGMTAMMSLAETNDKQLGEFLNSASVGRDNQKVTLRVSYSSARLAEMVKNIQQSHLAPQHADPAVARTAALVNGTELARWTAEAVENPPAGPAPVVTHSIENVTLRNGSIITLARQTNGGRNARFDRLEITPVSGGAPLVFTADFMRQAGPRNNWLQAQFPGLDGSYNLVVGYINDPSGKTEYAVSARPPRRAKAADEPPSPAPAAVAPEPAPAAKQ